MFCVGMAYTSGSRRNPSRNTPYSVPSAMHGGSSGPLGPLRSVASEENRASTRSRRDS